MSTVIIENPPDIYRNRNVVPGSYYDKCIKGDLISKINGPLKHAGYYLSYHGT